MSNKLCVVSPDFWQLKSFPLFLPRHVCPSTSTNNKCRFFFKPTLLFKSLVLAISFKMSSWLEINFKQSFRNQSNILTLVLKKNYYHYYYQCRKQSCLQAYWCTLNWCICEEASQSNWNSWFWASSCNFFVSICIRRPVNILWTVYLRLRLLRHLQVKRHQWKVCSVHRLPKADKLTVIPSSTFLEKCWFLLNIK